MSVEAPGLTSAPPILCSVGQDGASLQALVAQVDGRLVGILIMKDEQVGAALLSASAGSPRNAPSLLWPGAGVRS